MPALESACAKYKPTGPAPTTMARNLGGFDLLIANDQHFLIFSEFTIRTR